MKISTGQNQMSSTMCDTGSERDLTYKSVGKLKVAYMKKHIDHDWYSSKVEAANVTHSESSNLCDNIAYKKE